MAKNKKRKNGWKSNKNGWATNKVWLKTRHRVRQKLLR